MTNDESNPNDEVEISGGTVLKTIRCLERLDRESGPERVTEREQGRTTSRILRDSETKPRVARQGYFGDKRNKKRIYPEGVAALWSLQPRVGMLAFGRRTGFGRTQNENKDDTRRNDKKNPNGIPKQSPGLPGATLGRKRNKKKMRERPKVSVRQDFRNSPPIYRWVNVVQGYGAP